MLLISGIAALLLALLNCQRSFGLARMLRSGGPRSTAPTAEPPAVSVLAPCRGVDEQFQAYVRALLCQRYPHYEVLFLVESREDPAWHTLRRLLTTAAPGRATLIVSGRAEGCSQKIHNLLVGLKRLAPNTRLLAFVDSDVHLHPDWLAALVAPLDDASVGATSGYRWYVPRPGSGAESLRSAWNAATLGLLVHRRFGFAWGGSMAIRRQVFDNLQISAAWARGLSDDLLLSQAVRGAGLGIRFVPDCLVRTVEPCSWRQLLEWTNRQTIIARVYMPQAWALCLGLHLTGMLLGLLGCWAVATGQWLAAACLWSYWLSAGLGSSVVCQAALRRLALHSFRVQQRAWIQAIWTPAVTALALVNLAASCATSRRHPHHGRRCHREERLMSSGRDYLHHLRSALGGRRFNLLIFFVTSRCNAKCDFCFYWEHLNHQGDLTLDEIRQISATMPPFHRLLFSGGETFMRKELVDIVGLFHRQNGVATINLPTNGILQRQIVDKTSAILADNPDLTVNVGFSLDGLATTHDRVRGVPGCFRKAIASIKAVTALRERFPNLMVFVNSVILHANYGELPALAQYLLDEVELDTHYFNIIRGDPMNPGQSEVPPQALATLYKEYERVQAIYLARNHRRRGRGAVSAAVWQAFYLGRLAIYNDIQYHNYTQGRRWPMPCTAGETAAVIDYQGDVRICELRQPIGNLRDYDCDFGRLWNAPARTAEVAQMRQDHCDCTHICFIDDSATYSPKVALLQSPVTYLRGGRERVVAE